MNGQTASGKFFLNHAALAAVKGRVAFIERPGMGPFGSALVIRLSLGEVVNGKRKYHFQQFCRQGQMECRVVGQRIFSLFLKPLYKGHGLITAGTAQPAAASAWIQNKRYVPVVLYDLEFAGVVSGPVAIVRAENHVGEKGDLCMGRLHIRFGQHRFFDALAILQFQQITQ